MRATLLSVASTHFIPTGTLYGLTVTPVAGGTVVVADLVDAGHKPNLNAGAAFSGAISNITFSAAGVPTSISAFGTKVINGLTVSFTSTSSVTVYHD